MRIISTHLSQTALLSTLETTTGYQYVVTFDHVLHVARIVWANEDSVQEVEASAAGGILRACDVPEEDAGLIAETVAKLATSPLAAALALDLQSRMN